MSEMKTENASVLVVDDDLDLCHLLSAMLVGKNLKIYTAGSLKEADEQLRQVVPSLIFLDNNLPDGQGIHFIRRLRSANADIKIVMMTADPTDEMKEKAIEEGCISYLDKPFSYMAVTELVNHALEHKS